MKNRDPLLTLLLIAALALVTGCSATGPAFSKAAPPRATEARVYIYRAKAPFFTGIQSHFFLNEIEVAALNVNGYTSFTVPAGHYEFRQHWPGMNSDVENIRAAVDLKPEATVYLRFTIHYNWDIKIPGAADHGHEWILEEVPEFLALDEVRETRFQPPLNLGRVRPTSP